MSSTGPTGFAILLRQILVQERNLKLKEVAAAVGLSARNFYGRVTGRVQFTPDEINRLLRVVPDPRLGEWLLQGSGLACARQSPHARFAPPREPHLWAPHQSALDAAMHGVEEAMAALRAVMHMRTHPDLTGEAAAEARAHVRDAQRQFAALEQALTRRSEAPAAPLDLGQGTAARPRLVSGG